MNGLLAQPSDGSNGNAGLAGEMLMAPHYARIMACFPGRPAQGVSEARAAMRGRQETVRYRVFKRDDSIDVLARAVRSGAARMTARRKRL